MPNGLTDCNTRPTADNPSPPDPPRQVGTLLIFPFVCGFNCSLFFTTTKKKKVELFTLAFNATLCAGMRRCPLCVSVSLFAAVFAVFRNSVKLLFP